MANAVTVGTPTAREPRALTLPWSRHVLLRGALCTLVAAGLASIYVAQGHVENQRLAEVNSARAHAGESLAAARAAGVPASALADGEAQLNRLVAAEAPPRILYYDIPRLDFFSRQRADYENLAQTFDATPGIARVAVQDRVNKALVGARVALAEWVQEGADPADTAPLAASIDRVTAVSGQLTDLRALDAQLAQAQHALASATAGLAIQKEDNAAQASYLQQELAAATADAAGTHKRADDLEHDAGATADAAVHFGIAGADLLAARIARHHAQAAAATAPQDLAAAVAWIRVDHDRLEKAMVAGMPAKAIYVSVALQELRAFENGKVVKWSLVTTGRPELPTDIGSFSVLRKNHPWTMHSPFPRSSPFWYPDTVVQYALWFNDDGSALHDAYWRSRFGPGTNGPGRSGGTHGCINMPYDVTVWMYDWAPVGTPVTVG